MPARNWTWREVSAVSAALVLGILAGPFVLRSSQPLPLVSEGGRIVAINDLDLALSTQLTGTSQGKSETTIGLSFRTATGQYCRTFAAQRGPAGLACRERGDWVIEVLARNPRPRDGSAPDGYRQAGTPFPDAIRQALVSRLQKEPLTQAEEAHAIKFRWRSESVLKEASP